MTEEELNKGFKEFEEKLRSDQQPLDPEFEKVFWENWWDLLE